MSGDRVRAVANVLGIRVDAIDMSDALEHVLLALRRRVKGYICVTGVHGVMEAQHDLLLAMTYVGASMVVPDGMPTVWVGHLQGHKEMDRVAGPDLMLEIFRREEFAGFRHFFFGGEEHVAEELREQFSKRFPRARIVGTYTPPFRKLSSSEELDLMAKVRRLKPDIIWVGISTPKQEHFMRHYLPLLHTTLMFGVGAAFDFHTGRIKDSPHWVKRAGLQWFHRLLQDPRRLWKRYLRNNPLFLWNIMLQLTGTRSYSLVGMPGVRPSQQQTESSLHGATRHASANPVIVRARGPELSGD